MTEYLEDGKPIENNENDECYWPLDAKQGVANPFLLFQIAAADWGSQSNTCCVKSVLPNNFSEEQTYSSFDLYQRSEVQYFDCPGRFSWLWEAYVNQEDLDTFLAIAEELQLKGLQGSTDQNVINETKEDVLPYQSKETSWTNQSSTESGPASTNTSSKSDKNALVSQTTQLMYGDLQELDQTVNSMMETSQNMIEAGNRKTTAKIFKACGKEGHPTNIKRHIELYHLEGVSIPCNNCEKTFRSRNTLQKHVSTLHNNVTVWFLRTRRALEEHSNSDH